MLWEFKEEKNKADWNCTGGEQEELYLLLVFLLEKQRQPTNENAPRQSVQSGLSGKFQELKEGGFRQSERIHCQSTTKTILSKEQR